MVRWLNLVFLINKDDILDEQAGRGVCCLKNKMYSCFLPICCENIVFGIRKVDFTNKFLHIYNCEMQKLCDLYIYTCGFECSFKCFEGSDPADVI